MDRAIVASDRGMGEVSSVRSVEQSLP
jgi:hypothetical protein